MKYLIYSQIPYPFGHKSLKSASCPKNWTGLFLKKMTYSAFKSDFSIAQNFSQDQRFYVKIAKTTTLLGLEPRIF